MSEFSASQIPRCKAQGSSPPVFVENVILNVFIVLIFRVFLFVCLFVHSWRWPHFFSTAKSCLVNSRSVIFLPDIFRYASQSNFMFIMHIYSFICILSNKILQLFSNAKKGELFTLPLFYFFCLFVCLFSI